MKKIVTIFLFSLVLGGCANDTPIPSPHVEDNLEEIVDKEEKTEIIDDDEEEKSDIIEPITAEVIIELASKKGNLLLEDFVPYIEKSILQQEGSIFELFEFEHNEETMYLRLVDSDKNLQGKLDGVTIINKEFLELDTTESEYAYDGVCCDIRSGNIEHILDGEVSIEDYITVTLPDNLVMSNFKWWLGSRGGVAFLNGIEENELTLENAGLYAAEPISGGIEIWGAEDFGQHISVIETFESITLDDVVIKREELQVDGGATWFVAYTDQEDSIISYYLYLNANEYTEEDFLEISETITIQPNAIY